MTRIPKFETVFDKFKIFGICTTEFMHKNKSLNYIYATSI
jgi:hypothetical protein